MKKKALKGLALLSTICISMEVYNRLSFSKTKEINNPLGGESGFHDTVFGKMFYTKKGIGPNLLLIHDTNIGSSSFLWRKNFEELSNNFTVYSIDLPGFGKSDKRALTYTSEVYTYAIKSFVDEVIGGKCLCIASGMSGCYAINVEHEDPDTFSRIVAISPTGVFNKSNPPKKCGKVVTKSFNIPILGSFIYNILSSRKNIEKKLKNKLYYNQDLASSYVLDHYENSSRQGKYLSKYAPASLIGGYMNESVAEALANFEIPLYLIWGANSKINPVDNLKSFVDVNPSINYHVFENCGEYPQEEYPFDFNLLVSNFLKKE